MITTCRSAVSCVTCREKGKKHTHRTGGPYYETRKQQIETKLNIG